MSFEIKIPLFEGPFDLLLFFIRRDEIDIHDIPISKITNDFLAYIKHLEKLNIEVASEFMLVAATLMSIKAKMLLPRTEKDEDGNQIDPRKALVQHLLEYKRYKSVTSVFEGWESNMLPKHKRGNIYKEIKKIASMGNVEAELQDLDLFKLLSVYKKVLERAKYQVRDTSHEVVPFPYNIEEQKEFILAQLYLKPEISFLALVEKDFTKVALVFNFLAILEMLAMHEISITIGEGFNNFWIAAKEEDKAQAKEN